MADGNKYDKKIIHFYDLNVWKEAHKLVIDVYTLTNKFPKKETYALSSQMLRAVVSVTSNIAEGFGRRGIKEKVQFYAMARASLVELQNQIFICRDVKYFSKESFGLTWKRSVIVHKMINALIKSLKR